MKYLFCLFVLCCVGCEHSVNRVSNNGSRLIIERIDGHEYVCSWASSHGGIVHAESCPCKVKAYKINDDGTTTEIK